METAVAGAWRVMRILGLVLAAAIAAVVLVPADADAAQTLNRFSDSARWSNTIDSGAVPNGDSCTDATCQSETVKLALPRRTWRRSSGGLLVSLQWPSEFGPGDQGYDLDLYVYGPDGKLVGKSDMWIFSMGEGVWVQNPKNGDYRVVIVPKTVVGEIPYDVVVNFQHGYTLPESDQVFGDPPARPDGLPYHTDLVVTKPPRNRKRPTPLLPDLVPGKARNFHMQTGEGAGFYFTLHHGFEHPPSCYPQETAGVDADHPDPGQTGPTRCLRFDQPLLNLGRGPYELRVYPDENGGTDAYQAIYRSTGGYDLPKAGNAQFAPVHGHIHFTGFDDTGLYTIGPDGRPGTLVAKQPDKGRCATDSENVLLGKRGDGPPRYDVPGTCDTNDHTDPKDPRFPGESYFRSGISAGWDDKYPWFIPDQYIDVSNVPDGRYLIVDRINSARNVVESNHRNDVSVACVEFHGTTAHGCPLPSRSR